MTEGLTRRWAQAARRHVARTGKENQLKKTLKSTASEEQVAKVASLLKQIVAEGSQVPAATITARMKEEGIDLPTAWRAKRKAGIGSRRVDGEGFMWFREFREKVTNQTPSRSGKRKRAARRVASRPRKRAVRIVQRR